MSRKTLLVAITAGAVLLLIGGVAAAQSTGGGPPKVEPPAGAPTSPDDDVALSTLDTDRDGSISRMEAETNKQLNKQFPSLDRNKNGALEPAEFARFEAGGAIGAPPPSPDRGER